MVRFQTEARALLLGAALVLPAWPASSTEAPRRMHELAVRLARGISEVADRLITGHADECVSAHRPPSVGVEVSAMLARALSVSPSLRVGAECRAIGDKEGWQDCRFYFRSPESRHPWTLGLTFLAQTDTGVVRADTVACFTTP